SRVPEAIRSRDEFVDKVESGLAYPLKGRGEDVFRSAFQVLSHHVPAAETRKIHESLPEQVRGLWPTNWARPARLGQPTKPSPQQVRRRGGGGITWPVSVRVLGRLGPFSQRALTQRKRKELAQNHVQVGGIA